MKRNILIFMLLLCRSLLSNAENVDSLYNIKGYYITRYLKDEISFSYQQKIKQLNNESYSRPIDYEQISFFIPVCINGVEINNDESILKKISSENNLNKDTLFFIPKNKKYEEDVYREFKKRYDLSEEICIMSEIGRLSPFYLNNDDNQYLYKCIYLEGLTLEKSMKNIEEERVKFFLDIDAVNRKSAYLTLFFLNKIYSYTSIVNIDGLETWFPYLEKK